MKTKVLIGNSYEGCFFGGISFDYQKNETFFNSEDIYDDIKDKLIDKNVIRCLIRIRQMEDNIFEGRTFLYAETRYVEMNNFQYVFHFTDDTFETVDMEMYIINDF